MLSRHITMGLVLVVALAGLAQAQTVLYVDVNADQEPHDGSDWCHAYLELYEALDAAGAGTTIRVADGTYLPDTSGLTDPREATFQLINGVTLEGGYAGCGAPDPNAHDVEPYETILSGDLNGDDGPGFENNEENCYHVFYHPEGLNLDATAVLDGFTVTGGNANGTDWWHRLGGGMYNSHSSPTLTDCTFTENVADDHGGGMCNYDLSSPTLTNCTFTGNQADYGGGMCNDASSPTLTNCTFSGNWVVTDDGYARGGGMYNDYSSSPVLTNCTFSGNQAQSGAGMYNGSGNPTMTNCTFSENEAERYGGGMHNFAGSPTVTNCTFSGNEAGWHGGGMCNVHGSPTVTNCTLVGNSAEYYGGGMYCWGSTATITNCTFDGNQADNGGGMYNYAESSSTVTNCTFSGNSADTGGGMHNDGSSPALTNCAFTGNTASGTYGYGGGMYNSGSPTLTNCAFSGNWVQGEGGGMCIASSTSTIINCILWNDSPQEVYVYSGSVVITYTDIEGGWEGEGNIDDDPLFVGALADLHLQAGSPCINTGSNEAPALPETDLDGHARVLCDQVDMGAYEFGIGDYECDQDVDLADFASWEACMTGPDAGPYEPGCEAFDFEYDGDVDLADFAGFQAAFTGGG